LRTHKGELAAFALASAAILAIAIAAALHPDLAVAGWLAGFVFWSGIPAGSLVLLLIDRLAGGRWGAVFAPTLVPAAMLTPVLILAFLPIAFGTNALFLWRSNPASAPVDVAHIYLTLPAFLLRTFIALLGWTLLAWMLGHDRCNRLCAGLGLAFYGLTISLVSVDWVLSIDPRFTSSAFAAGFAVQQILSALAFAAVIAPERRGDAAVRDLAGLLIATLLGVVYIDFMAYVVAWYGNLPEKAAWYLDRAGGWVLVLTGAIVIGAVLPFALLLSARARASRAALRVIGALILCGVWLHIIWLVLPTFESRAVIWAFAAAVALMAVSFGAIGVAWRISSPGAVHV
jgi:hypothetical protein